MAQRSGKPGAGQDTAQIRMCYYGRCSAHLLRWILLGYVYHMWIDGDGHAGNGGNDVDDGGDSVDEITTT